MDKFVALTTLVCVAEQGSFSRAALQLGKTPSAVAKAIASLESDLGARLLERTTRRMQLTEAGRLYAQAAREALGCLSDAGEEIMQMQLGLYGELRIASPLAYSAAFLSQACAEFCLLHPHLKLQVDLSDDDSFILESGHDLLLNEGECNTPGLIVRPIASNRIVLIASPDYLAKQSLPVNESTLAEHVWLRYRHPTLDRHFMTFVRDAERIRSKQPVARLTSDSYDFLLANALAGVGLLAAPLWSVAPYLADGRLQRVMADCEIDPDAFGDKLFAAYPSHRRATRKVHVFIEYLRNFLEERGHGLLPGVDENAG